MYRNLMLLIVVLVLVNGAAICQSEEPDKADAVLHTALQEAGGTNRTVLLMFHASWCGWCKRLDAVLENADMKKIMGDHYGITHLDVMERDAKKALENPGGNEMMGEYGGAEAGLPSYAFLNSEGKKIADSNVMPKDQNIGYPGSPEEIVAFEKLLKETAPRMTDEQRGRVVAYHQKNAPR